MRNVYSFKGEILTIPAKMRRKIDREVVIIGFRRECIFIYPQNKWARLKEKLEEELSSFKKGVELRQFKRAMFSQVWKVSLNRQGRISIPSQLRKHNCLRGSKIIITYNWQRDRIEIRNTK